MSAIPTVSSAAGFQKSLALAQKNQPQVQAEAVSSLQSANEPLSGKLKKEESRLALLQNSVNTLEDALRMAEEVKKYESLINATIEKIAGLETQQSDLATRLLQENPINREDLFQQAVRNDTLLNKSFREYEEGRSRHQQAIEILRDEIEKLRALCLEQGQTLEKLLELMEKTETANPKFYHHYLKRYTLLKAEYQVNMEQLSRKSNAFEAANAEKKAFEVDFKEEMNIRQIAIAEDARQIDILERVEELQRQIISNQEEIQKLMKVKMAYMATSSILTAELNKKRALIAKLGKQVADKSRAHS